jgi:predicted TIM-barrel fold metal-dependent hydrolase
MIDARTPKLEVVDAQVHAVAADSPLFPWDREYGRRDDREAAVRVRTAAHLMPYERLLAEMDKAGVDAAVIVMPAIYGYDSRYGQAAATDHPSRLGVVGRVDALAADLEDVVGAWRSRPGMLGMRLLAMTAAEGEALAGGRFDPLLAAAQRHRVPICIYAPRQMPVVLAAARRFPDLALVVDHLGVPQGSTRVGNEDPLATLPEVLALAAAPNVSIKVTGVPSLSSRPYPFHDVWPALRRVIEAFRIERVMWGSDFTRTAAHHTYGEAIGYIKDSGELTPVEKRALLGANLRRIFDWPRA